MCETVSAVWKEVIIKLCGYFWPPSPLCTIKLNKAYVINVHLGNPPPQPCSHAFMNDPLQQIIQTCEPHSDSHCTMRAWESGLGFVFPNWIQTNFINFFLVHVVNLILKQREWRHSMRIVSDLKRKKKDREQWIN